MPSAAAAIPPLSPDDQLLIHELYAEHAHALDAADVDAFTELFAYPEAVAYGLPTAAALRAWCESFIATDAAYPTAQHFAGQLVIEPEAPDRARVRAYVVRTHHVPGIWSNRPVFLGTYEDVVVKRGERWRFALKDGRRSGERVEGLFDLGLSR